MFKSFYIIHFEFQNAHFVPNTNAVTSFNKKKLVDCLIIGQIILFLWVSLI